MSDNQQQPPDEGRVKKPRVFLRLAILAILVIVVLAISAIYLVYFWPSHEHDYKWYRYELVPSSNVTMTIVINTTGPQQVTIQNSSSDAAAISMYCAPAPEYYQRNEEGSTIVGLRWNNTFGQDQVKVNSLVNLPPGPRYHLTLIGKNLAIDGSTIVNKYGGGNLTIRVIDIDRYYPGEHNSSSNEWEG